MDFNQILNSGKFRNDFGNLGSYYEFIVPSDFLGEEVILKGFNLPRNKHGVEWDQFAKVVKSVVAYSPIEDSSVKSAVFEHYHTAISETSFGFVEYSQESTILDSNQNHFKIENEEEAMKQLKLQEVFTDMSFTDFIYFNLVYHCPWEPEHGLKLGIMNGEFDSIY